MTYIGNIDKKNYVVVFTDAHNNGILVTKTIFLHNTKISKSEFNEELMKSVKRGNLHPQGRIISLMEMYYVMLKYCEVYTGLIFVSIPTFLLELRAGIEKITSYTSIEDRADIGSISNNSQ